jgi:S-(hydroxymethyl)mycothiol dehydrogenase
VLIGIPRADAVLTLPALPIPRRELRVMGSAYGSTRPDRDFPATIELYRDGRLPLDRLITHRLPLSSAQHALGLVRDGEVVRAVLEMEGSSA